MRYECSTTQDVLYVRLAPRRHDRSVPMLSMDARPLYLRLLGGTMGVLTRGWYTYHLGDAFFIFSPGHAEALHSDRIWTPERYRPMTWVNRTPQRCEPSTQTGYGPQRGIVP